MTTFPLRCRSSWPGRPERSVPVRPGQTLLDALRTAGVPIASSCGAAAVCGKCWLQVLEGADAMDPRDASEQAVLDRDGRDGRLACRTGLHGPATVTADYW